MFLMIEDNYLKMNRGDSYTLPLVINEGTKLCFKQYQLRQFDKIYVGIMEYNQAFEDALIRKVLTITSPTNKYGHPLFKLTPEDTEYLLTGKYFIEIKLVQKENDEDIVTTILPLREFFINGTNKEVIDDTVYQHSTSVTKTAEETHWEELEADKSEESNAEYEWIQI